MRRLFLLTFLGFYSVLGTSCTSPEGYVKAESIQPLAEKIVERHNAYVQADEAISDNRRESFIMSGDLLLRVLEEAMRTSEDFIDDPEDPGSERQPD